MRILFDQGVRGMRNKGNIALLQVALARLSQFWPSASLEVISSEPHLLKLYWPSAHPVSPDGRYDWSARGGRGSRYELVHRAVPAPALRLLFEAREEAWRRGASRAR